MSSPDQEARDVFGRGRDAYARGDYASALEDFQRSYELSQRPELLFNIGQAADRLRRDREAVEAFEGYLQAIPETDRRVEVEARLAILREQIARDDALVAEAARAGRSGGERAPTSDTPVVEEWWFWTLIGVAVVGAGVGIGLAVGSHDELEPPTPGDIGPGGVVFALGRF